MIEKILRNIILKQNLSTDLKNVLDWLYEFNFFKDKFYFLCGYLHKEL